MKKSIIPIIIIMFCLVQSGQAQYNYSEQVIFSIDWVDESRSISTGHYIMSPEKGYSYVFIYLTVFNQSDSKQSVDFSKFYLLDYFKKEKYKPEFVMGTGVINVMKSDQIKLSNSKQKSRKLVFVFPEYQKANFIQINDEIIELE